MARVSEFYGSRFMKAVDIGNQTRRLQIVRSEVEEIGEDHSEKIVLTFADERKSLALNATNAETLSAVWGDESSAWEGRWIEIYSAATKYGGKSCQGIRVRAINQTAVVTPPADGNGAAGVSGAPIAQGAAPPQDAIPF